MIHVRGADFQHYKPNKILRSGVDSGLMRKKYGEITNCKPKSGLFVSFCIKMIFD